MAETFAWMEREAIIGPPLVEPGGDALMILVATAPDLDGDEFVTDLDDVGERGESTFLVSLGSPAQVSLATTDTLDPGTDCVGWVVAKDSGSDATSKVLAYVAVDETDDPITTSLGVLFAASRGDVSGAVPWPDQGGPHDIGTTGLATVADRGRVWMIGQPGMSELQLSDTGGDPLVWGDTIHADHRPAAATLFVCSYDDSGTIGALYLFVGSDGSITTQAVGLDDSDVATPLVEPLSWHLEP